MACPRRPMVRPRPELPVWLPSNWKTPFHQFKLLHSLNKVMLPPHHPEDTHIHQPQLQVQRIQHRLPNKAIHSPNKATLHQAFQPLNRATQHQAANMVPQLPPAHNTAHRSKGVLALSLTKANL